MITIVALDASRLAAWASLFDAASSTCFCRYWHFDGKKNDWLARCALAPETNRAEAEAAVSAGDPAAGGLVAMDGPRAVGWMKLAPRVTLPKLRGLPVYRARDLGEGEGIFSVGCFLVDPAQRGRGVAHALLDAAPEHARARGGRLLEAYPRRTDEPIHAEEAWMGPEALFVAHGFTRFESPADIDAYPVYRRAIL